MAETKAPVGRFAPTPSGRMHMGNVFAGLLAWLSVRSQGGAMVLRMEDLDTERTSPALAETLRQDLLWLGLDWDVETPPQSQRSHIYEEYFEQLREMGLIYPCYCTRSQLHSVNAPHLSDGTYVYPGTCRGLSPEEQAAFDRKPAWRLMVPDKKWEFTDLVQGRSCWNLASDCGDFALRRADGVFLYQLAVTVDDALAGVTQVVRGADLISSVPRQMYLQKLLGFPHPEYGHVPMLRSVDGRRLSKRDKDMDLGYLQQRMSAEELLGKLANAAGLTDRPEPVSARELAVEFSWSKVRNQDIYLELF
ncbi:MAG: tRNA glutamyl-Q(34) synthetase GluQRS [Ruminococcaceae bacterium]|nr:tRNA glutamyl-Q(34) synthetase GluQRS [Oscillospiraceae bacterium]